MAKYVIYENKDGQRSAHTEVYTKKAGEKKVGTAEGSSADEALTAYNEGAGAQEADESAATDAASSDPNVVSDEEADKLREEEESKEEYEVMQDAQGRVYIKGQEPDSESKSSSRRKAEKAPEPPPVPEPGSLGKFRAKDAATAIKMAKGEHADPAAGASRGAQTP